MRDCEVLHSINRVRGRCRQHQLDRLPLGTPGDPHDCVYARAWRDIDAGVTVGAEQVRTSCRRLASSIAETFGTKLVKEGGRVVGAELPDVVQRWIGEFDRRGRSHLVDPNTYDLKAKQKVGAGA
ncbi:hypothetical protein IT414_03240 [bacterium]|nr:hypothetical protein [bacterium]